MCNSVPKQECNNDNLWKTKPITEEEYDAEFKGKEEGAAYMKDSSTGLWMFAVTEETCKDNDGFVCKVRLEKA